MYDDAGRLVSSRPEPEWDDTEREWMHALDEWKRDNICQLCGLPTAVCRDKSLADRFAPWHETCFVRAAQERYKRQVYADDLAAQDAPAHVHGVDLNLPTAGAP